MIAIMICDDCNQQMTEIFTASENFRLKGWMCEGCFNFAPAIGREKKWTMDDQTQVEQQSDGKGKTNGHTPRCS